MGWGGEREVTMRGGKVMWRELSHKLVNRSRKAMLVLILVLVLLHVLALAFVLVLVLVLIFVLESVLIFVFVLILVLLFVFVPYSYFIETIGYKRYFVNSLVFYFRIPCDRRHCEAKFNSTPSLKSSAGTPFRLGLNKSSALIQIIVLSFFQ
jgi:glucan phosphoethanolaminetransferase (alkaline phosphatase superfamily)